MTDNSKDARHFFAIKKKKQEADIKLELSFIDTLFMLYKLRRKIVKIQAEIKSYDSIKQYTHNYADFIFYKSMSFRSSYLEDVAKTRNNEFNVKARPQAAENYFEVLLLQYSTLLFNCEQMYMFVAH